MTQLIEQLIFLKIYESSHVFRGSRGQGQISEDREVIRRSEAQRWKEERIADPINYPEVNQITEFPQDGRAVCPSRYSSTSHLVHVGEGEETREV